MCIRDRYRISEKPQMDYSWNPGRSTEFKLLKLQKILDIDVEVESHTTLNIKNGVVVCRELLHCMEEEFTTELALQGIIAFRRRTNGAEVWKYAPICVPSPNLQQNSLAGKDQSRRS